MNTQEAKGSDDTVLPFQLEASSLRGRIARLGPSLNEILNRHTYPQAVGELLGEAMAIASVLGTSLKFKGIFTFQVKSDGAVGMLVCDVSSDGSIRAYAQYDKDKLASGEGALLGKGYLAFTADGVKENERYQGIVELDGGNLSDAVQHYFKQSEQIPTGIIVSVGKDTAGNWRGGCIMLQRMPKEGGVQVATDTSVEDDWLRAMVLMKSCSVAELTDAALSCSDLLYRLFNQEGVRVYDALPLRHRCRCSDERVMGMIKGLPRNEVEALAVNGVVTVTCEFCNRSYDFNEERLAKIYKG